jgi:diguanylate cyclase (GGDEF)-like protein/putative nucleotidyltransferase with HDIG domain
VATKEATPASRTGDRVQRRYAALERIFDALVSDDDLQRTLAAIAAATATAVAADRAWFALDDGSSAQLALSDSPTSPAPLPERCATVSIAIPLLYNGSSHGTFHLVRQRPARPFTAADITFARETAARAGLAIERGLRDAEPRRRAERAEALREIGRVLSAELDFDRFHTVAQEQVARIVDHGSCWLALWDEEAGELDCRFYMADGVHRPDMQRRLTRGTGLAWVLVDERKTLNTPDYVAECQRRTLHATNYGTAPRTATNPWLGVPLLAGGRLVGVMAVQRLGRAFSDEEASTLELLAGQIAAALENARLYAEARQLASRDPLTGLANHRALHERIDAELAQSAATGQPFAVIMADLDNFKLFNDTYGHPVGDQVLRIVADTLCSEAAPSDSVGRYGGDEFLVILPGADATGALAYIARVRERLAHHHPALGETSAIPLALSSGIAVYPHDAQQRHALIALADSALYASKRGGGRTVVSAGGHAATLDLAAHTGFGVVEGLVLAVDTKDQYTVAHSQLVADTAALLGELLGLPDRDVAILRTAGLLHDVGKVSIPDRILRKPARLTREEWQVMRQHVEFGELIIRGVPSLQDILEPVMHHHERWDGKGYPRGLAGEEVPLLGRIMIVADAYSAMTLDRPYRRGLSLADALAQLRAGAGTQFDPHLVAVLCDPLSAAS